MTDISERVAALPRVKFVWRRSWNGPDSYEVGVYCGKCPNPQQGEIIYRRWFVLEYQFRFHFNFNWRLK